MSERQFVWSDEHGNVTGRLYAQQVAGEGTADVGHEGCWYATYWTEKTGVNVQYWRLNEAARGSTDVYNGAWITFGDGFKTVQEAKTAAENLLRLNLAGWP